MGGIFVNKYRLPRTNDYDFSNFLEKSFGSKLSNLIIVKCYTKPNCLENECHSNVSNYVKLYGGSKITGYYLIADSIKTGSFVAIKHSVYLNTYGEHIDITPFSDKRKYNIFLPNSKLNFKYIEFYNGQIQSLGFNI